MRARELPAREVCAVWLRGVGNALGMYAREHEGDFPCLGRSAELGESPVRTDSLQGLYVQKGCNLQAYWLLVEMGLVGEAMFHCPCDGQYKSPPHDDRYGFASCHNSSYAFQPATRNEANQAYPRAAMDDAVVIVGDRPRPRQRREWNANHRGEGGHFLRIDGRVAWHEAPHNRFGVRENHVYYIDMDAEGHAMPPTLEGLPRCVNDSYLYWPPASAATAPHH